MKLHSCLCWLMFAGTLSAATSFCQNLDGSGFRPGRDPDIDKYLANWVQSMPHISNGTLVERDILTQGDPLNPPRTAAVLQYATRLSRAELGVDNATRPTTLKGSQEIFYITSGKGQLTSGGKTTDLSDGVCFLVPQGVEFTIRNTGAEQLVTLLLVEPVPEGFAPRTDILLKIESTSPITAKDSHWSYQTRDLFTKKDGLATLNSVSTITMDPMTIGHPYFNAAGTEEIWAAIKGDNIAYLGKQIRKQPPGTAYAVPPDGRTNHCNLNQSKNTQVKMLYVLAQGVAPAAK
jgi:uncharacterized cupin superfamily protein